LNLSDLPARAARRVQPLLALLSASDDSLGSASSTSTIASAAVQLRRERATLARIALPHLAQLLARPPAHVEVHEELEARLLDALGAMLGTCHDAPDGPAQSLHCLDDLMELLQRLMTTYSITAARGALSLIRRLLASGPEARAELLRVGARRFVERLATGSIAVVPSSTGGLRGRGALEIRAGSSVAQIAGNSDIVTLAAQVLEEIKTCGSFEAVGVSVERSCESGEVSHIARVAVRLHALSRQEDGDSARQQMPALLHELGEALLVSTAANSTAPAALPASSFELETLEVPQALVALLDRGAVDGIGFAEHLGDAGASTLAATLVRLVEEVEELPVCQLPPYLNQSSSLRVLSEPLIIVLQRNEASPALAEPPLAQEVVSEITANTLIARRSAELAQHWLQVEPLMRVQELERMVLLTTSVVDSGFLTWCVNLVGREVAPRTSCLKKNGPLSATCRVLDFRLATPLLLPIHRIRRMADGVEEDLVASVHGLVAMSRSGLDRDAGATSLQVALLQLEILFPPREFETALVNVCASARIGRAEVSIGLAEQPPGALPPGCEELLRALDFEVDLGCKEKKLGVASIWSCPLTTGSPRAGLLEDLIERRRRLQRNRVAGVDGTSTPVEPDPEIVAELCQVFPENGAKRACCAVRNSSSEAAMEWACQHQGDSDFADPLPDVALRGGPCDADPKAPVWSVFIVLPEGVPFDLVWPMLEDPVKGALTSVANAWTAMGWAGGEAEMLKTLRSRVEGAGEGAIARGLPRAKAERVASRLRSSCECRVEADPEGAAGVPLDGQGNGVGSGTGSGLVIGTRVQLLLEAEQLGFVVGVHEVDADGAAALIVIDVVVDDGRLLSALPADRVRVATRLAPQASGPARPGNSAATATVASGVGDAAGQAALTSVAEPLGAPSLASLRCQFEALDRGAQESDVVRRLQPEDLRLNANTDTASSAEEASAGAPSPEASSLVGASRCIEGNGDACPDSCGGEAAPMCRVAFGLADPSSACVDRGQVFLLRGERAAVHARQAPNNRSFSSTSWLTVGCPGLAVSVGRWYYEIELTELKNPQIGWADASFRFLVGAYSDDGIGDDVGSWAADGERKCLWHRGRAGDWRTVTPGQTISSAIELGPGGTAKMWFAVDGSWDEAPVFETGTFDSYFYPAVSGQLDCRIRLDANELVYPPPDPSFQPIGEVPPPSLPGLRPLLLLPPDWSTLQGLCRLASADRGLPDAPTPFALRSQICVDHDQPPLHKQVSAIFPKMLETIPAFVDESSAQNPLSLKRGAMEEGLPLSLDGCESERALEHCGISSVAARASLRLLRELQVPHGIRAERGMARRSAQHNSRGNPTGVAPVVASDAAAAASGPPSSEASAPVSTLPIQSRGASRRFGTKLERHLAHPLACCSGAFPRWCRELPILVPWLFPLATRETLLRCSAFGLTFAVRWLQERMVDEKFAERRRVAEDRLAQAKHIGDAALLNGAYESLFELQGQIARDADAWVGSLKSELVRVERDHMLEQAERLMDITRSSPCSLEVQFDGESGFGRAVTQGFYTLVAHELQRRAANREVPMWIEDDVGGRGEGLNEDFLRPRRGLLIRPLKPDDPCLAQVERRFCMLGRLMAKALREGFVVPLPLTAGIFQLMLGGPIDPASGLPCPGDGVAGEFVGACAALVSDATRRPGCSLESLAADPDWSRKYMQPDDEETVAAAPFAAFADSAVFLETGFGGAALLPGGENVGVNVRNVTEFVRLASAFWLSEGIERQMVAFRRGLYDVLGSGAAMLWAFDATELTRLFCGENEVAWTEKELAEYIHCGGGYSADSECVRWLREELLAMAPLLRAKFLDFVTSCSRLPPGGLKELALSVHPDPCKGAGLPRSRACAHRLFLPRYASRDELARQLHEAIIGSCGHHEQQLPP